MKWLQLIEAGQLHLQEVKWSATPGGARVFSLGARWMHDRLQELGPTGSFDAGRRYTGYGLLKYGVCLAAFGGASALGWLFIPLAIFLFYLCEIHFLFLFPLLIDRAPRPLLASIRATYKVGVGRCFVTVIPIAAYMLAGLMRGRLYNWYVGCLAIVIWYNHEVRNRL
ncbi:MAG TPA: hypothetical protein VI233_01820 [Puia sp.]